MKPNTDEIELAVKARNGDAEALASIAERLRGRLFSTALAQLRNYDDAQDVTANALIRICSYIGTLREPDRLRAWSDGILRNEVRRLTSNRRSFLPLEDFDGPGNEVEGPALMRMDIRKALRGLPNAQSHAISMFYLDGTPIADIAMDSGRPVGSVKSWLHHGRKRLQTLLEEYGPMVTQTDQDRSTSIKRALLVQAELTPDMLERLAKGLRRRGYDLYNPTEQDIEKTLSAYATFDMDGVRDWLREFDAFIFDEMLTPVPTIAQIVNIRAEPELRDIPIFVLVDDPLDSGVPATPSANYYARFSMSYAYFNAGVDGMIIKSVPDSQDLVFSDERAIIRWDRITPRAGKVLKAAIAEAADLSAGELTPEHVLIGITLTPECLGAVLLSEFNGVDLERLRETIIGDLPATGDSAPDQEFGELAYDMLRQAQAEANSLGHTWLGAEHFLCGMLRQPGTPSCAILTKFGLTLGKLRDQIPTVLANDQAATA